MTTLATLKTDMDQWLTRDDVATGEVPTASVIRMAEAMIARDIRCVVQETSTDISFDSRSEDLPSDFLEIRLVFVDDNVRKVRYMEPQALRESTAWNDGRVASFYTLEGNPTTDRTQMTIAGPASASSPTTVTVLYWARFSPLTLDPDTNWLLTNHYDVYLYAALAMYAQVVREMELEQKYMSLYRYSTDMLSKHENRKRYAAIAKTSAGTSPRSSV